MRSIPLIGADWVNVQGIEYDSAVDKLFATELGYTGFDSPLMRINASTGELENYVYFNYGNDLFLTQSHTLLVGCYVQPPGMFDENLIFGGVARHGGAGICHPMRWANTHPYAVHREMFTDPAASPHSAPSSDAVAHGQMMVSVLATTPCLGLSPSRREIEISLVVG